MNKPTGVMAVKKYFDVKDVKEVRAFWTSLNDDEKKFFGDGCAALIDDDNKEENN
jgi:hypothetical protein